jgi:hypothetical protein
LLKKRLSYFNYCVTEICEYFDLILIFRPGLQDPTYVPPNVSEDLVRSLDSQVANSIEVLSRIVAGTAIPTVPVFDTFVMLTEDSTDVRQNWDKSAEVSFTEFLCQVGEFIIKCLLIVQYPDLFH